MKISNLLKNTDLVTQLRGLSTLDEIQISSRSESRLGQVLSPDWKVPFVHPVFGYFASIQAYWTWLVTKRKDNSLRTMYSSQLNKYQHEHGHEKLNNIRPLIAEALLYRIVLSSNIRNLLKSEPEARFRVWYTLGNGVKQDTFYSDWYSRIVRDLQAAIKNNSDFDPTTYGNDLEDMQQAYDEVLALMTQEEIDNILATDPSSNSTKSKNQDPYADAAKALAEAGDETSTEESLETEANEDNTIVVSDKDRETEPVTLASEDENELMALLSQTSVVEDTSEEANETTI